MGEKVIGRKERHQVLRIMRSHKLVAVLQRIPNNPDPEVLDGEAVTGEVGLGDDVL